MCEPFAFVTDLSWVEHSRLHSQEGQICWCQGPFCQELNCLCPSETVQEKWSSWSRSQKAVDLKSDDRSWVEPQCTRMFSKVSENILRVEETNHGNSRRYINGVNIMAEDYYVRLHHRLICWWTRKWFHLLAWWVRERISLTGICWPRLVRNTKIGLKLVISTGERFHVYFWTVMLPRLSLAEGRSCWFAAAWLLAVIELSAWFKTFALFPSI